MERVSIDIGLLARKRYLLSRLPSSTNSIINYDLQLNTSSGHRLVYRADWKASVDL